MSRTYREWQQVLEDLKQALNSDPANLELATRYWRELRGHAGFDYRSSDYALRIFRQAAIHSPNGAAALSNALREVADDSGEYPEPSAFDLELRTALTCAAASQSDNSCCIRWLLDSLGGNSGAGSGMNNCTKAYYLTVDGQLSGTGIRDSAAGPFVLRTVPDSRRFQNP